jgi:hypothetical protein
MVFSETDYGRKGVVMWNPLGTKLCPKCKQRKPVKGSTQTRDGKMVACAGCKR